MPPGLSPKSLFSSPRPPGFSQVLRGRGLTLTEGFVAATVVGSALAGPSDFASCSLSQRECEVGALHWAVVVWHLSGTLLL